MTDYYAFVREVARRGSLSGYLFSLEQYRATLPRWRWFRRLHIERQIMLVRLALDCYRAGAGG